MGFDAAAVADRIEADLRAVARLERAEHEKAYLKSPLDHLGASMPAIHRVTAAVVRGNPDLPHDDVVALAEALWAAPVHERRAAAVDVLDLCNRALGPADLVLVERYLREARGWALVDGLAANVAGPIVARHPAVTGPTLDRWAGDDDFWVRRASLLALLVELRQGRGDPERFFRYADSMLDEPEFFVRKAIGWVLRDMSRLRPDTVHDWLLPRAGRASGVTVREAVKRLSPEQRAAVLAARQSGR